MSVSAFHDLLRRVRAGDADAAAELVRQYEPEVRRIAHSRLTDPRLRRTLDSLDICQSVLLRFLVWAATNEPRTDGQKLDSPEDLVRLLTKMAQNKILEKARSERAARRDMRRLKGGEEELEKAMAEGGATPSRVVAGRELLAQVWQRLTAEDRYLAEQRAAGRPWTELGQELNRSPEALRKQLARALDVVARQLELGPEDPA